MDDRVVTCHWHGGGGGGGGVDDRVVTCHWHERRFANRRVLVLMMPSPHLLMRSLRNSAALQPNTASLSATSASPFRCDGDANLAKVWSSSFESKQPASLSLFSSLRYPRALSCPTHNSKHWFTTSFCGRGSSTSSSSSLSLFPFLSLFPAKKEGRRKRSECVVSSDTWLYRVLECETCAISGRHNS